MKILEFKITSDEVSNYFITFFNEDKTHFTTSIGALPKGLELNKHYSITDIYGYVVGEPND